jgi:hypothetical protein
MWHTQKRGQVFTGFWLGGLKIRDHWDNIRMDLREIEIDGVNQIQLAQDRVHWHAFVNMVMNLWVPQRKDIFLLFE